MNTIAITVLLGGIAAFMILLIIVSGFAVNGPVTGKNFIYPLVVVTGVILLFFLKYAVKSVKGRDTPVLGGAPGRLLRNYIHKDTPRKTAAKFFVVFFVLLVLGLLISPQESLVRTAIFFGISFILIRGFIHWALEYDPLPAPGVDERDCFTKAELEDTMRREMVLGLPGDVVFGWCLDTVHTIWGRFSMTEQNMEAGTIDFMFAGSHLSFVITPVSERSTRVILSISPDLPRKWSMNRDRRQNIRYLERIRALLEERAGGYRKTV